MNSGVMGFLFNDKQEVLLIEKSRPKRYSGRLNGIGGKIEKGESPVEAMDREFFEETGARAAWNQFCYVHGNAYEIYCFTSREYQGTPSTKIEGKTAWYPVNDLPTSIIADLQWLVPMANYVYITKADVFLPYESP